MNMGAANYRFKPVWWMICSDFPAYVWLWHTIGLAINYR
ncbi:hypothetical protein X975_07601, partial [Stegodyphus mimosarum]